jgi:hypothetical protein
MAHVQLGLVSESAAPVPAVPDDSIKGKVMKRPETFEFEGERLTVAQIMVALRERRIMVSESTVRIRLRRGQTTARQIARPIATVNRAWNAREMRT